jgi:DNA-binding CsgD family transcriptional regulator
MQLLVQEGELKPEAATGRQRWDIRIPSGVYEAIERRLDRLSESCHRVLTVASVIGREFELRLLEQLEGDAETSLESRLSGEELLEAVEEALAAKIIEEIPQTMSRYQFAHVLIQDTLVRELSAARRVRLHARIAEALEELYGANCDAHAAELAHHYAEVATVTGTEKLVRYSLLAGERALAAYAHEEALEHFQRGLAAKEGQPMDAESAALFFGLGRAQVATLQMHQSREAVANLNRAFDYYAEAGDVDHAVAVAEYPLGASSGILPGAAELIAQALTLVSPDSRGAGRLLVRNGWYLGRMKGDYQSAQEAFSQARAIALRQGDPDLEMQTAAAAAEVDLFYLRCQESLEKTLRAIELACQADNPRVLAQSHQRATLTLTILGDLQGARLHAEAGLAPAERLRDRFWLDSALWSKQFLYRLEGNWLATLEMSERALALSPEGTRVLADRALLEYELGDFSRGETYLKRLIEVRRQTEPAPTTGQVMPALVIPLVARISRAVDGLDTAQATAERIISAVSASPLVITMARAGLAILAVLRGDASAAQEQYTILVSQRGTMVQTGAAAIDRVLGLLAQTMGQPDVAAVHFKDALVFCRKAGARSELAWTCYDYANLLQETGQNQKALTLLDEALAISTDLGMKPLVEKAQVLKVQAEAQQCKTPIYPANLTRRQVEVLQLIAEGKTNREIAQDLVLSQRTVQRHVADIYVKIGSRNRSEATAFVLSDLYPVE